MIVVEKVHEIENEVEWVGRIPKGYSMGCSAPWITTWGENGIPRAMENSPKAKLIVSLLGHMMDKK